MSEAYTSEDRQGVIDAVIDTYDIDVSNVKGSVQYDSEINSQGRTDLYGVVTIGAEPFNDHSVGYLALAIEHEVEVHLNNQLYGDRWYVYEGNTMQQLVNLTLSGLAEHEAYTYMLDRAEAYGLTDDEINSLLESVQLQEIFLGPFYTNYVKVNGYSLPLNEKGQPYVIESGEKYVVGTVPIPQ